MFKHIAKDLQELSKEKHLNNTMCLLYIVNSLLHKNLDTPVTQDLAVVYFTKYSIPFTDDTLDELSILYNKKILNDYKEHVSLLIRYLYDKIFESIETTALSVPKSIKNTIDNLLNQVDLKNDTQTITNLKLLYEMVKFEYIDSLSKSYHEHISFQTVLPEKQKRELIRFFDLGSQRKDFDSFKIKNKDDYYPTFGNMKKQLYMLNIFVYLYIQQSSWYTYDCDVSHSDLNTDNFFEDLYKEISYNRTFRKFRSMTLNFKPLSISAAICVSPFDVYSKLEITKEIKVDNNSDDNLKTLSALWYFIYYDCCDDCDDCRPVREESPIALEC